MKGYKKYHIDYSFFEKDSPELWYFIGFFYADGCLTGTKTKMRTVTISVSKRDEEFLQGLVEQFSCAPLHMYYSIIRWQAVDVKLYELLKRFSLHPRKTFTLKFPEVPGEYMRDFIRGYFDGDGSFYLLNKSRYLEFNITSGSENFMRQIYGILQDWGCRVYFRKYPGKEAWVIKGFNFSAKWFAKNIYYPGCFCLRRKVDIVNRYIGMEVA